MTKYRLNLVGKINVQPRLNLVVKFKLNIVSKFNGSTQCQI